jgi:glycosyltransferase involved in cell wall biosynthesis
MKKISVIIPTYKRPDLLKRALDSVYKQTYSNYEILVVDDNSDSSTQKETQQVCNSHTNIKYLSTGNIGASLARNYGASNATGDYLAFLDDDDYWDDSKLEKQLSIFLNSDDDNLGVVYCKAKVINEKDKLLEVSSVHAKGNVLKQHLMSEGIARTPAALILKSAFQKVEGFRKLISRQEYDLFLRIFANGYTADFVDEYLLTAVIHGRERITTNPNKIHGEIIHFENKKNYFHLLNSKEIKQVTYNHYIKMSDLWVMVGKKHYNAVTYLIKAILIKPFKFTNYLKLGITLLFLYRPLRIFQRYLKTL